MKKLYVIVAILLVIAMLPLALFSCNSKEKPTEAQTGEPTEAPTQKPTEKQIVGTKTELLGNADKVKINGRWSETLDGLAIDNVGSGIEFCGNMKGEVYVEIRTHGDAYFSVYIDGVKQEERLKVRDGRRATMLCVADLGETAADHTIRVVKQTEARYARAEYRSITVDGTLSAPPSEKDIYIEFAGSSLCCGMGNIGWPDMGVPKSQSAQYEEGTQGFAFLAAEALGADHSILGVSGMGLAKTWFPPLTLDKYYNAASYYRDEDVKFDFESARTPDIVVLNVGKNDGQLTSQDGSLTPSTDEEFVAAARSTLDFLREKYGDEVVIVWAYDIYDAMRMSLIEPILEEYGGESAGYYACKVTSNRLGGDYHTDVAGHEQAAKDLVEFMKSKDFFGLDITVEE